MLVSYEVHKHMHKAVFTCTYRSNSTASGRKSLGHINYDVLHRYTVSTTIYAYAEVSLSLRSTCLAYCV